MKKETIEQAIKYYAHNYFDMHEINNFKELEKGFEAGAKGQQERSYSEEEVLKLLLNIKRVDIYYEDVEKWVEQFKKR